MDEKTFLRHMLATIAYRGGKTLRDAPEGFGSFSLGEGTRTAAEILAHIGDLLQWLLGLADGEHRWSDTSPEDWESQVERFHTELRICDERLASDEALQRSATRLFQGPLADALTHIGQLAIMRRLAGSPVQGENYYKADIEIGRVGPDQPPPVYEFD